MNHFSQTKTTSGKQKNKKNKKGDMLEGVWNDVVNGMREGL
jgi:hypothetical protein